MSIPKTKEHKNNHSYVNSAVVLRLRYWLLHRVQVKSVNKQGAEVNFSDVAPPGIVDKMLQSLEKQLDDVDSKIGNNWLVLNR
ncbi:hypothetical protein OROMI_028999 [Orobanche minor]